MPPCGWFLRRESPFVTVAESAGWANLELGPTRCDLLEI